MGVLFWRGDSREAVVRTTRQISRCFSLANWFCFGHVWGLNFKSPGWGMKCFRLGGIQVEVQLGTDAGEQKCGWEGSAGHSHSIISGRFLCDTWWYLNLIIPNMLKSDGLSGWLVRFGFPWCFASQFWMSWCRWARCKAPQRGHPA